MNLLFLAAAGRAKKPSFNSGPGPSQLVAGDQTWGFYGELPELISQTALASAIGLTAGAILNESPGWFKFNANGKTLFVPKRPLRSNVTWYDFYKLGAVYGSDDLGSSPPKTRPGVLQNARVTIGNDTYRVRLMKGFSEDPFTDSQGGLDHPKIRDGEFNRLILPMLADVQPGQTGENWASYTHVELGIVNAGARQIVQEASISNDAQFEAYRFYLGRSLDTNYAFFTGYDNRQASQGWRPVLELIA